MVMLIQLTQTTRFLGLDGKQPIMAAELTKRSLTAVLGGRRFDSHSLLPKSDQLIEHKQ